MDHSVELDVKKIIRRKYAETKANCRNPRKNIILNKQIHCINDHESDENNRLDIETIQLHQMSKDKTIDRKELQIMIQIRN